MAIKVYNRKGNISLKEKAMVRELEKALAKLEAEGQALDFKLTPEQEARLKSHPDGPKKAAQEIIEELKKTVFAGQNVNIRDEYNYKSENWTGTHMHAEFEPGSANGGLISGPKSGYPFLGHGTELVIPDAEKLKNAAGTTKTELTDLFTGSSEYDRQIVDLLATLNSKMEDISDTLSRANRTHESILNHIKV